MRILNRIAIALFVITAVVFGFFYIRYNMSDRIGPTISFEEEELVLSIHDTDQDFMDGVTAVDNNDGDLTDSIILENLSNFTEPGQRVATYAVFDHSGNLSRATRVIRYKDYESPRFEISEPLILPTSAISGTNSQDYIANVSATDCIDGDISHNVKIVKLGELQEEHYGTTALADLQVFNSAGDVAKIQFPIVYQTTNTPKILLKEYVVYLEKGDEFDPEEYLDGAEDSKGKMTISEFQGEYHTTVTYNSKVDTSKKGEYTVSYACGYEDKDPSMTYMVVIVR